MAEMLIDNMTTHFDPAGFKDKYEEELRAMLEARAEKRYYPKAKGKPAPPTNIVNLLDVLKKSLETSQKHRPGSHPRSAGHSRTKRKKTGS